MRSQRQRPAAHNRRSQRLAARSSRSHNNRLSSATTAERPLYHRISKCRFYVQRSRRRDKPAFVLEQHQLDRFRITRLETKCFVYLFFVLHERLTRERLWLREHRLVKDESISGKIVAQNLSENLHLTENLKCVQVENKQFFARILKRKRVSDYRSACVEQRERRSRPMKRKCGEDRNSRCRKAGNL